MAIALAGLVVIPPQASAQYGQMTDPDWSFQNENPAYPEGDGPQIIFSSKASAFVQNRLHDPLVRLAISDGFRTREAEAEFAASGLPQDGILVIVNPYLQSWREYPAMLPPSAFSDAEILTIRNWVENGGALLLLADHAPLGGGSSAFADAFGFNFLNCHAIEDAAAAAGLIRKNWSFSAQSGLNSDHPITNGGMGRKPVEQFFTFGGQAFLPPKSATVLLRFPLGWTVLFAMDVRREYRTAQRMDASGTAQGAAMEYGRGRLAVFTEASAFSAQQRRNDPGIKTGFNTPQGRENPEFVLSVLRWLAHYKPDN